MYRKLFTYLLFILILGNIETKTYYKRANPSKDPKLFTTCLENVGCIDINEKWYDYQYRPINLEPLDRHTIRTEFLLMKRSRNDSKEILYDIITLKTETVTISGYKRQHPTVFLIHDFTSNGHTGWIKHIALALAEDFNVISVDWEAGAEPPYDQAIANARIVALEAQAIVKMLKAHFGLKAINTQIIGHGVGAHIAGYIGKNIKGISKITGLDPTGPRFENMPSLVRLDPEDANYVEVLHTDAFNSRSQGTLQPMGHSDFYINNAGHQPGCNDTFNYAKFTDVTRSALKEGKILPGCSHKRSFKYYISSIITLDCKFVGIACTSYEAFINGSCSDCAKNMCQTFDICPPPKYYERLTKFYVNTDSDPPYCMHGYQVNISIEKNPNAKKTEGYFEFILVDYTNKITFATGSIIGNVKRTFIPGHTYTLIVYAPTPPITNLKEAKVKWTSVSKSMFKKPIYVKYVSIKRIPMIPGTLPINTLCPETGSEIKPDDYVQFNLCNITDIEEPENPIESTTISSGGKSSNSTIVEQTSASISSSTIGITTASPKISTTSSFVKSTYKETSIPHEITLTDKAGGLKISSLNNFHHTTPTSKSTDTNKKIPTSTITTTEDEEEDIVILTQVLSHESENKSSNPTTQIGEFEQEAEEASTATTREKSLEVVYENLETQTTQEDLEAAKERLTMLTTQINLAEDKEKLTIQTAQQETEAQRKQTTQENYSEQFKKSTEEEEEITTHTAQEEYSEQGKYNRITESTINSKGYETFTTSSSMANLSYEQTTKTNSFTPTCKDDNPDFEHVKDSDEDMTPKGYTKDKTECSVVAAGELSFNQTTYKTVDVSNTKGSSINGTSESSNIKGFEYNPITTALSIQQSIHSADEEFTDEQIGDARYESTFKVNATFTTPLYATNKSQSKNATQEDEDDNYDLTPETFYKNKTKYVTLKSKSTFSPSIISSSDTMEKLLLSQTTYKAVYVSGENENDTNETRTKSSSPRSFECTTQEEVQDVHRGNQTNESTTTTSSMINETKQSKEQNATKDDNPDNFNEEEDKIDFDMIPKTYSKNKTEDVSLKLKSTVNPSLINLSDTAEKIVFPQTTHKTLYETDGEENVNGTSGESNSAKVSEQNLVTTEVSSKNSTYTTQEESAEDQMDNQRNNSKLGYQEIIIFTTSSTFNETEQPKKNTTKEDNFNEEDNNDFDMTSKGYSKNETEDIPLKLTIKPSAINSSDTAEKLVHTGTTYKTVCDSDEEENVNGTSGQLSSTSDFEQNSLTTETSSKNEIHIAHEEYAKEQMGNQRNDTKLKSQENVTLTTSSAFNDTKQSEELNTTKEAFTSTHKDDNPDNFDEEEDNNDSDIASKGYSKNKTEDESLRSKVTINPIMINSSDTMGKLLITQTTFNIVDVSSEGEIITNIKNLDQNSISTSQNLTHSTLVDDFEDDFIVKSSINHLISNASNNIIQETNRDEKKTTPVYTSNESSEEFTTKIYDFINLTASNRITDEKGEDTKSYLESNPLSKYEQSTLKQNTTNKMLDESYEEQTTKSTTITSSATNELDDSTSTMSTDKKTLKLDENGQTKFEFTTISTISITIKKDEPELDFIKEFCEGFKGGSFPSSSTYTLPISESTEAFSFVLKKASTTQSPVNNDEDNGEESSDLMKQKNNAAKHVEGDTSAALSKLKGGKIDPSKCNNSTEDLPECNELVRKHIP